eukprot:Skav227395  [mRNA]  locus=scaffold3215:241984:244680:+ [translate_table: standard]
MSSTFSGIARNSWPMRTLKPAAAPSNTSRSHTVLVDADRIERTPNKPASRVVERKSFHFRPAIRPWM